MLVQCPVSVISSVAIYLYGVLFLEGGVYLGRMMSWD